MPFFKCTLKFNHQQVGARLGGWAESHYINSADSDKAYQSLISLKNYRIAMLGNRTTNVAMAVTEVGNPGNSFEVKASSTGPSGTPSDTPWQAIQMQVFTSGPNKATFDLRGVPDAVIVQGVISDPGNIWLPTFTAFGAALVRTPWLIRGIDKTKPLCRVTSVSSLGVVKMTDGVPGATKGSTLKFFRSKYDSGGTVKLTFTISDFTDTSNFTLHPWPGQQTIGLQATRLRLQTVGYFPINGYGEGLVTKRNVGKPFFQLVGRRSSKK